MSSNVKPGDFRLWFGILMVLCGPFVWFINAENDAKFAVLAEQGIVAAGTVTDMSSDDRQYTTTRGRTRTTTDYMVEVSYDALSEQRYAEWRATGRYAAPSSAIRSSWDVTLPKSEWEDMAVGQQTHVVYLPGDLYSMHLASTVESITDGWQSPITKLIAVLLLVAGAYFTWSGGRIRYGWFGGRKAG